MQAGAAIPAILALAMRSEVAPTHLMLRGAVRLCCRERGLKFIQCTVQTELRRHSPAAQCCTEGGPDAAAPTTSTVAGSGHGQIRDRIRDIADR
jgi:hypothetical protein